MSNEAQSLTGNESPRLARGFKQSIPRVQSALVIQPRLRKMPWGTESILLGGRPEDGDAAFAGVLASHSCESLGHSMVKDLRTDLPISLHLHPGLHEAMTFWDLKSQSSAVIADLLQELRAISDPRGKTECFLVLDVKKNAAFYCGWNYEEIGGLHDRFAVSSTMSNGLHGRSISDAVLRAKQSIGISDLLFERADSDLTKLRAESSRIRVKLRSWNEIERQFSDRYNSLISRWLDFVVSMRPTTSSMTLTGILLVFAFTALEGCLASAEDGPDIQKLRRVAFGGDRKSSDPALHRGQTNSEASPICDYFGNVGHPQPGSVITIPPCLPHGAGPGLHLIEVSQNSLTTLRCFDHGRSRPMHPVLAGIAMSEVDGTVRASVQAPSPEGLPPPITLGATQFVAYRSRGADTVTLDPGSVHVVIPISRNLLMCNRSGGAFLQIPPGHAAVIARSTLSQTLRIASAPTDFLLVRVHDHGEQRVA